MKSRKATFSVLSLLVLVVSGGWVAVLLAYQPQTPGAELSLGQLQAQVAQGRIRDVTLLAEDGRLVGTASQQGPFWADVGKGELLATNAIEELSRQGVATRVDGQPAKNLLRLSLQFVLPILTMGTLLAVVYVIIRGTRSGGEWSQLGKSTARRDDGRGVPHVTFADVAGVDEAIEELMEVKSYLTSPRSFDAVGAKLPKGILLAGPPGCGKTLLVRALAGEARVRFFSASASQFVEMLSGVGAARVRDLFVEARSAAPAIVFIDELDAIGRARSAGSLSGNPEYETTLNELLVQLDGFEPGRGILLIGATNRPDMLDPALLRKGRFDRQIVVDQPDLQGRLAIFRVHARGKPIATTVVLEDFARRTPGFTGADIAATMNEAALLAARRNSRELGADEISEAIQRVTSGAQRRSRILGAEEKRRVAYHEGGHVLVGWMLNRASRVDRVSIVARGHMLGQTISLPDDDRRLLTRSQLEDEITVLLAGYAAEDIAFSDPSSGAQNDLLRATVLARQMVSEFGMSEAIGPLILGTSDGSGGRVRLEHSGRTAEQADVEVRRLLAEADERARQALAAGWGHLGRLVEQLIVRETLERSELEALLGDIATGLPPAPRGHVA